MSKLDVMTNGYDEISAMKPSKYRPVHEVSSLRKLADVSEDTAYEQEIAT